MWDWGYSALTCHQIMSGEHADWSIVMTVNKDIDISPNTLNIRIYHLIIYKNSMHLIIMKKEA